MVCWTAHIPHPLYWYPTISRWAARREWFLLSSIASKWPGQPELCFKALRCSELQTGYLWVVELSFGTPPSCKILEGCHVRQFRGLIRRFSKDYTWSFHCAYFWVFTRLAFGSSSRQPCMKLWREVWPTTLWLLARQKFSLRTRYNFVSCGYWLKLEVP